jgi:hypothetical protein
VAGRGVEGGGAGEQEWEEKVEAPSGHRHDHVPRPVKVGGRPAGGGRWGQTGRRRADQLKLPRLSSQGMPGAADARLHLN